MIRDVFLLLKIQMLNLFGINRAIHTNDKLEKLKLFSIIIVLALTTLIITVLSFSFSQGLAMSLSMIGLLDYLPVLMMTLTSLSSLFTTIYKISNVMFGFRDYDMLMSLPVNVKSIICSRIFFINLINIILTLAIMIPAGIVYAAETSPGFEFYIIYSVTLIFIPLIPIIIATAIGYLISFASSRFKHANIINIIFSVVITLAIVIIPYFFNETNLNYGKIGEMMLMQLDKYYPLASLYHGAVVNSNIISAAIFIGISASMFIVFVAIMANKFKSISTMLSSRVVSSRYKMGKLKESSQFFALYKNELIRYFSSPIYVLNTSIGSVLLILASAGIMFFGIEKMSVLLEMPYIPDAFRKSAPIVVAAFSALGSTTACSISMEGINLWIKKTLPVEAETIFRSKIAVNLTILIPAILLGSAMISISLGMNLMENVFIYLTPICYSFFIAIEGLIINLHFPKLDWISETTVVKQSASTFISMIIGALSVFIPIRVMLSFPEWTSAVVSISTAVIAVLSIAMYMYLSSKGREIFNKLFLK